MIGMVQRAEVDLAMFGLVLTEERFNSVNYSFLNHYSTLSFMTDAQEPMPKNLAIFYPFSTTLWIALVLLAVAMSFVFYLLLRQTYQRVLLSTLRSTLENSIDFKMEEFAIKTAAIAWILSMFVVTNGYKAVLLSFLSFPTMIGIRNISELSAAAATGSFKCITYAGSYSVEKISPKFIRFVACAAPKIKPYESEDKDGKVMYVYDARLMPIIANYFGAPYEIVTPADGAYGASLPGGNWTGMIGMVRRQEGDLAMPVVLSEERFRAVNYSYPYRYGSLSFMTDSPQPTPKNLAIFYPFSATLWATLLLVTVVMSFVFYFLLSRRQTYQRVLVSTFRSLLENAIDFKMTKPAVKMAAFTWILAMFIVTNGYKALLLSFLSFPRMIGIRDIPQLSKAAATGSFNCLTFPGSSGLQDLLRSSDPSWKAIGKCLIDNEKPGNPLVNFANAPYGKAFVGSKFLTTPYQRRFFVSEDNFFIEDQGIPFSKTFCCPEDLNRVIHRLVAAGIFEQIRSEEVFYTILLTPSLTPEPSEESRVITLGDMSGAFYVLLSGWFASFITLIIEILVRKSNGYK